MVPLFHFIIITTISFSLTANKNQDHILLLYKMQCSMKKKIGEIYSLTNQIRLQLNRIRKTDIQQHSQRRISSKKFYKDKQKTTRIIPPFGNHQQSTKIQQKKHYKDTLAQHVEFSKDFQRKHYAKHYKDTVDTSITSRRKTSHYFNIGTQRRSLSPNQNYGNSLVGIGKSQKLATRPKSCIRLFPETRYFQKGFI